MKAQVEVKLLVSNYAFEINLFVDQYLDKGYQLQGQIQAVVVDGKVTFFATMIKEV